MYMESMPRQNVAHFPSTFIGVELSVYQAVIWSLQCDKVRMLSGLDNFAVFNNQNYVGVLHGWQTMGNDNASSTFAGSIQSILYDLAVNKQNYV